MALKQISWRIERNLSPARGQFTHQVAEAEVVDR